MPFSAKRFLTSRVSTSRLEPDGEDRDREVIFKGRITARGILRDLFPKGAEMSKLTDEDMLGGAESLTPERVVYLVDVKGVSQSEIGRVVGRSRQWVSILYRRGRDKLGAGPTLWEKMDEWMPFTVPDRTFTQCSPYKRIRHHLRWQLDRDSLTDFTDRRNLVYFYDRMTDEVLEYDPNITPHEGVYTGGFRYLPRDPADGKLIFRVNAYTGEFSDLMIRMWRVPIRADWPRD